METLQALKERIVQLIEKIKELSSKNEQLLMENEELGQKILSMESALLNNNQNLEDLVQEKSKTKHIVDDLLKSIDALISNER
jgi:hypothetical protein